MITNGKERVVSISDVENKAEEFTREADLLLTRALANRISMNKKRDCVRLALMRLDQAHGLMCSKQFEKWR